MKDVSGIKDGYCDEVDRNFFQERNCVKQKSSIRSVVRPVAAGWPPSENAPAC